MDRELVRKLFKYAETWEQLRRVQQQQLEALQSITIDLEGSVIWFGIDQPPAEPISPEEQVETQGLKEMRSLLKELTGIGEKIDIHLVKETREIIQRAVLRCGCVIVCWRLIL